MLLGRSHQLPWGQFLCSRVRLSARSTTPGLQQPRSLEGARGLDALSGATALPATMGAFPLHPPCNVWQSTR